MNDQRRKSLNGAIELLNKASTIIDAARDGEQDALDNMPENLEGTDRYEKMEIAVDNMEDAIEKIDRVVELLTYASR